MLKRHCSRVVEDLCRVSHVSLSSSTKFVRKDMHFDVLWGWAYQNEGGVLESELRFKLASCAQSINMESYCDESETLHRDPHEGSSGRICRGHDEFSSRPALFKSLQHSKIYDGRQEVGKSLTGVEQARTTQKLLSLCASRQWEKEGK